MTMTGRIFTYVATAVIVLSALNFAQPAQSQNTAPVSSGDHPQLLPGLDKNLIDTSADPCVDFFQYACGHFNKLYPIPNDRSGYGTGALVSDYT
jgi:putative endopeptidase